MKDIDAMKNSSVEILKLSVRSSNRLKRLNINTIGELTSRNTLEDPFVCDCWSGHKAEKGIVVELCILGLCLGMTDDDWNKWSVTEVKLPLSEDYYRVFFNNVKFNVLQETMLFVDDYLNKSGLIVTGFTDITQHFDSEATTFYSCFSDVDQAISFYDDNSDRIEHILFLVEDDKNKLENSKKRIEEIFQKNDLQSKSLQVSLVPSNEKSKTRMIYQKFRE
ncbi:MAG: hypothetical protein MJ184_12380 [Treponema sp.]|uniref:DNA-directed RNA polymerase subunit alpha C-terminal domain-containing protein n=1 Tax=Treponema sp. TaxID=166 RepID=UPI00298ECFCE|nr:DNA-directed RNA polymerase subunit alpha C-terminal domain-containing protein [Treponema sp.]MCQ2602149.1 hypothetical protein [Treponema sp.]